MFAAHLMDSLCGVGKCVKGCDGLAEVSWSTSG